MEKEVNNLQEEMEELHLRHSAELKAVKSNLEVTYLNLNVFMLTNFLYSSESNRLRWSRMKSIKKDKNLYKWIRLCQTNKPKLIIYSKLFNLWNQ